MAKTPKKLDKKTQEAIAKSLAEFHMALGLSVVMLQQTEKALKKDSVSLRVMALSFRSGIRGLQRMQRKLFVQLEQARVVSRDSK